MAVGASAASVEARPTDSVPGLCRTVARGIRTSAGRSVAGTNREGRYAGRPGSAILLRARAVPPESLPCSLEPRITRRPPAGMGFGAWRPLLWSLSPGPPKIRCRSVGRGGEATELAPPPPVSGAAAPLAAVVLSFGGGSSPAERAGRRRARPGSRGVESDGTDGAIVPRRTVTGAEVPIASAVLGCGSSVTRPSVGGSASALRLAGAPAGTGMSLPGPPVAGAGLDSEGCASLPATGVWNESGAAAIAFSLRGPGPASGPDTPSSSRRIDAVDGCVVGVAATAFTSPGPALAAGPEVLSSCRRIRATAARVGAGVSVLSMRDSGPADIDGVGTSARHSPGGILGEPAPPRPGIIPPPPSGTAVAPPLTCPAGGSDEGSSCNSWPPMANVERMRRGFSGLGESSDESAAAPKLRFAVAAGSAGVASCHASSPDA